uniref:Potassium channel subfamily K member 1-like n=1 Tax=Saccoglossus kowalevskii TaxID=10224 RepID=A0ABM0MZ34_SACKO|nr:PREDICTED: potassium channel subfamily K member 1-like [Saccoglossus kowalevskii]
MKENVNVRFVLLIFFFVVYLCIGGAVFSAIEGPAEEKRKEQMSHFVVQFLNQHECIHFKDLNEFIEEVVKAYETGVSAVNNATDNPKSWNFASSLFFAATVITTIGLPLTLLLIGASVERLGVITTKFLKYLISKLGHLYRTVTIQLIHIAILGLFIFVFFYIIPAIILDALEPHWSFFESVYFCFISLTTIGLGDYIPGETHHHFKYRDLYKVCIVCYLMLGLIAMVLILELMVHIPELNAGLLFMIPKHDLGENTEEQHLPTESASMYTLNTESQSDNDEKPLTKNIK